MNTIPWYRQFWPWFLICLPLASVIGGVSTVIIAFSHTDDLVNDQWYKEGRMINQTLTQDDHAKALHLDAMLFVTNNRQIKFILKQTASDITSDLKISFEHPTQKKHDQTLTLQYAGNQQWLGSLPEKIIGKYYVTITAPDETWRLKSEINVAPNENFSTIIHP